MNVSVDRLLGLKLLLSLMVWCLGVTQHGLAQDKPAAVWKVDAVRVGDTEALITFEVALDSGWVLYAPVNPVEDVRLHFVFEKSDRFSLVSTVREETAAFEVYHPAFGMRLRNYEQTAVFSQRIRIDHGYQLVKGSIRFVLSKGDSIPKVQGLSFSVGVSSGTKNSVKIAADN